jgi:hypothetical protein
MKPLLLYIVVLQISFKALTQTTVSTSTSLPIDLTGANSSCLSFVGPSLAFNVPASANGQPLTQIKIIFEDNSGSMSLGSVDAFLVDNLGNCYHFLNTTTSDFTNALTYIPAVFVSANHSSCLNQPNLPNLSTGDNAAESVSGNYGIWASAVNFPNHSNVSGTWRIYFKEGTSNEPLVTGASLEFGGASTASNQIGNGDNCIDPIVWNGQPICATTGSATTDLNTPGNALIGLGNSYNFVNGGNCNWMSTLENDIWIKFSVNANGPTCISLSGLDGSTQSIVVSDANADGDNNPCTGVGYTSSQPDPNWIVRSCPDPSIYSTNGTQTHQQHCFNGVVGQTYYLVIDGTGGAESPFYIDGTNGVFTPLPVELIDFEGEVQEHYNLLKWSTASENNNDYFEVQRSLDGISYHTLERIPGKGTTSDISRYSHIDYIPLAAGYYRLMQVDYDGKNEYSEIIYLEKSIEIDFAVYPQLVINELSIYYNVSNEPTEIYIVDYMGVMVDHKVLDASKSVQSFDVSNLERGGYIVYLINSSGTKQSRFIKN